MRLCFTAATFTQSGIVATDGTLDPECVPLCEVLGHLPGVEVVAACSGHETRGLWVAFTLGQWEVEGVASPRHDVLWPLLTACALSEQAGRGWHCVCIQDTERVPGLWCLSSLRQGAEAAEDARRLAQAIALLQAQRGTFPDA